MSTSSRQLIGESPEFHALMDKVSDAAALNQCVLIVGERGTGKELVASRLHFLSPRWEQVYVQVNCAAYSDVLLDEALFGRSHFDGRTDIDGHFVRAEGGTLFLNNIETVSLRLQEKLLQTLNDGLIDPLGGPDTQDVNVRILAATHTDLPKAVQKGHFSADLLDHLTFDVMTLPPLRLRPSDIAPLSQYFGRRITSKLGAERFPGVSAEALATLMAYAWPGNIRELKTVIERSTGQAFLEDESLSRPLSRLIFDPFESPWNLGNPKPEASDTTHSLNTKFTDGNHSSETNPPNRRPTEDKSQRPYRERLITFERSLIDEALSVTHNHQGHAATYLGLSYHQFRGLLRKHGLKK